MARVSSSSSWQAQSPPLPCVQRSASDATHPVPKRIRQTRTPLSGTAGNLPRRITRTLVGLGRISRAVRPASGAASCQPLRVTSRPAPGTTTSRAGRSPPAARVTARPLAATSMPSRNENCAAAETLQTPSAHESEKRRTPTPRGPAVGPMGSPTHEPPWHVSFAVQALPSSHVAVEVWQPPGSSGSVVVVVVGGSAVVVVLGGSVAVVVVVWGGAVVIVVVDAGTVLVVVGDPSVTGTS